MYSPPVAHKISDHWHAWLADRRRWVDQAISRHLNTLKTCRAADPQLLDAVAYSLSQPGKRARPILVLAAAETCGGDAEQAWPAALAIECVHTFSLIHDDLPAMDDDDLRRGQPTNHKVFGEALAILAGDWLATHAFEVLGQVRPERVGPLVAALADGTLGMISGQAADIQGETLPTDAARVEFIHLHKTAKLIAAAARMGAVAVGASAAATDALERYGRHLGLAFQIVDDLLDCTSTAAVLGKQAGKDAGAGKQTYPAAFGVEESRRQAAGQVAAAIESLAMFGPAAENLRGLAHFVLTRER